MYVCTHDELTARLTKLESGMIPCLREKLILCQPHHTGGLSQGAPPLFSSVQWSFTEHMDIVLSSGDIKTN